MPKCSFSGESISVGTGIMYVQADGKVFHFKNSKCMKNFLKLKRKPLRTKWTSAYRAEKAKRVANLKAAAPKPAVKKSEAKSAPKPAAKKSEAKSAPKPAAKKSEAKEAQE